MGQFRKFVVGAFMIGLLAACSVAPAHPPATGLIEGLSIPSACYARIYDAAHLAAHPRQTVTRFFVGPAGEAWRATAQPNQSIVAFGFEVTGRQDVYTGVGVCEPDGARASCFIEGDGGAFTIEPSGEGLRIVASRIEVEGANDFSPDLALADNRVMLLRPAPATECPAP